jgi:hypothetical protein
MRNLLRTAALLAATTTAAIAQGGTCADVDGNWFCQAVNAITYTQVGGSGTYNRITAMDSNSGACSSSPYDYSGTMSPLDEEVRHGFNVCVTTTDTP